MRYTVRGRGRRSIARKRALPTFALGCESPPVAGLAGAGLVYRGGVDTWLGLSIHARPADKRRVLAARRAYLVQQIAGERQTAAEIAVDAGNRARVAAVMVGLCIEQFETELRWLAALEDVLLDR